MGMQYATLRVEVDLIDELLKVVSAFEIHGDCNSEDVSPQGDAYGT